jgi:hypothetical protein
MWPTLAEKLEALDFAAQGACSARPAESLPRRAASSTRRLTALGEIGWLIDKPAVRHLTPWISCYIMIVHAGVARAALDRRVLAV